VRTAAVLGVLAVLPGLALADAAPPSIPDTPAGHALSGWLDAFNSGDGARIDSFDATHLPRLSHDQAMGAFADSRGYELESVEKSGRLWIIVRAKERANPKEVIVRLAVHPDNPAVIWWLSFEDLSPGAEAEQIALDGAERDRVLESAAKLLDEFYVFPNVGKKMAATLRKAQNRHTYRAITDGQIFAWRLSDDLWATFHDGHLGVRFSREVLPPEGPRPRTQTSQAAQRLLDSNCSFEWAEHLPPNIGYLKFDEFSDPTICAPTAAAAMSFLANSDALVIDLRENHGGAAEMVAFIASYLFARPTHLNDIYWRKANATEQAWTLPYVPGAKFIDKPVFVLTSKQTFSAAEDFCYALKNLKRATLIGETTGGGAHPVAGYRIDDHFSITVPVGRSISPITKTDWEGIGVEPDVKVPAADALDEALRRARSRP
jgi:retinol-binding protein 3